MDPGNFLRYSQIITLEGFNPSGKLSIVSNSQEMASQIPYRILYNISLLVICQGTDSLGVILSQTNPIMGQL